MAESVKRARRRPLPKPRPTNALDVFINCPFDRAYLPFFHAIIWTVIRSGYRARCAQEIDDGAQNRLGKIMDIIAECRFGVHDISNTEADGDPPLPRFNMPLELGLWFGAHHFGGAGQAGKQCIILDREKFRFQRLMSDIAGQDIHSHERDVETLIAKMTAWLRDLPGGERPGGGKHLAAEYAKFRALLPALCEEERITVEELTFKEFVLFASSYIAQLGEEPAPVVDVDAGSTLGIGAA